MGAVPTLTRYQARYCEENAWHLAADHGGQGWVLIITNERRACPIWCQKASESPDSPVVWDYHVVWLSPGLQIWDLDCSLGYPLALQNWLHASFPHGESIGEDYAPAFRVVTGARYLAEFASDRRHMKSAEGEWMAPPPMWPEIQVSGTSHNLPQYLDTDDHSLGDWIQFDKISAYFDLRT